MYALVRTLLAAALLVLSGPLRAEPVAVWVYHNFPPFVVSDPPDSGLSHALAERLTRISEDQFEFQVQVINRSRLNTWLSEDQPGVVLWANPVWFGDKDRTRYLWSDALMPDTAAVISPASRPVEFDGAQSLVGLNFVGVRGHRYIDIDELIAQKKMFKTELGSEQQVVNFIASGRGDVSVLAGSAADYYTFRLGLDDKVHFSKKPHFAFERYILVQPGLTDVHEFLNTHLPSLLQSEDWRNVMRSFGMPNV